MRRPEAAVLTGVALAVLPLAGCGGPDRDDSVGDYSSGARTGFTGQVGDIALRNVYIAEPPGRGQPPGSSTRVFLHLQNQGQTPDALVRVTSPAAAEVLLLADPQCDGSYDAVTRVPLPPGDVVGAISAVETPAPVIEPADFYVELRGLTGEVRSGETLEVTFTFDRAGVTTMQVPVELPEVSRRDPALCPPPTVPTAPLSPPPPSR